MKKFLCTLLSVIICITLLGCSNQNINQQTDTPTSVSEHSSETAAPNSTEKSVPTSKKESTAASSTAKATQPQKTVTAITKTAKTTVAKSTTAVKKSTVKKTTVQNTTTTTAVSTTVKPTVKHKTTVTAAPKSTAPTTKTTTQKAITCSVTIECKSILDNLDDLKAGHEAYVPGNGIILNSCTVEVEEGATVFDAVSKACKANGITMTFQNSLYGKYITGFNNIDEKDCSPQSGWIYQVNGVSPSKSCDKCTITNKDKIIFSYICSF